MRLYGLAEDVTLVNQRQNITANKTVAQNSVPAWMIGAMAGSGVVARA